MAIITATPEHIVQAAGLLRSGRIVAFPTETVYGLGADATNLGAVEQIFRVKGRPTEHPLIVHLGANATLASWARDVPSEAKLLARMFWPGPLTLILQKCDWVLEAVTGGQPNVGLRMPAHPVARALLDAFGGGIAAPSANRFGRVSATTARHVEMAFGDALPVLDGGACNVGIESTIIDLTSGVAVLLRPGAISPGALTAALGYTPLPPFLGAPRVSGSLPAHYAPSAATELISGPMLAAVVSEVEERGVACGVLFHTVEHPKDTQSIWKRMPGDPQLYARELYASLHFLDQAGVSHIYIEAPPEGADWLAINDRLRRATGRV